MDQTCDVLVYGMTLQATVPPSQGNYKFLEVATFLFFLLGIDQFEAIC